MTTPTPAEGPYRAQSDDRGYAYVDLPDGSRMWDHAKRVADALNHAHRNAVPREVLESIRKAIKNATGFVSCASGADDWCGCGDCRVEWEEHRKRMEAALSALDKLIGGA